MELLVCKVLQVRFWSKKGTIDIVFIFYRLDPTIPLNYAVFLYNLGDRKAASKVFTNFEERLRTAKQASRPIDPEVSFWNWMVKFIFEERIQTYKEIIVIWSHHVADRYEYR
jgi:hypothetical protein